MDKARPPAPDVALPHEHDEHEGIQIYSESGELEPVPGSLWGVMAEFPTEEALAKATRTAREAGYAEMDAHTPYPSHNVIEALGVKGRKVPILVLIGGVTGLVTGYLLQYWTAVIDYPLNVGGRPFNSWPSFLPVTFEMTILLASFAAVFGMLALNGLPMPYHPAFNVDRFAEHASTDSFFLIIEATDPRFDYEETHAFLESLRPMEVTDVPH